MSVNRKQQQQQKEKFIAVNRVLSCWNILSLLQHDNNVIECKIVEQTKVYRRQNQDK